MTGVFFLGICIIYPNGLFNSYCFAVRPFAEYFASVFGCSVEGVNACIVFTSWYVLECCCYNISFDVFLYKCSVVYRTFLSVYTLNCRAKNYIISCCIFRYCICYSYCVSFRLYACNSWCGRCCSCYCEFNDVGLFAKYFLSFRVTFPSVAVCIVGTLLYIVEVCVCLQNVLADIYTAILVIFFGYFRW